MWPWWRRFLVLAAVLSLVQVPMWAVLFADSQTGVWPVVVQAGAIGVVTAALMTTVQQPMHRSVVEILGGLDQEQRACAFTSVRRGPVPVDPVVLTAGIRLGTLILGLRKQTPRWLVRFQWVIPATMAVLAVVSIVTADVARSVLYIFLTLVLAVALWFGEHILRRTYARVELMRPQLVQMSGGTPPDITVVVPPPLSSRRLWLALGGVAMIIGITAATTAYLQRSHTNPQCPQATDIVDVVLEHKDLLLGKYGAGPHSPTVADYQNWSDQLKDMAAHISQTDLAPPAKHIAELSGQASALIRLAQTPDAGTRPGWGDTYFAISKQILDETGRIQDICYTH